MLNAPIQNRLSGPHDYIVAPSSVPTPRPSPPPVSGRSVDPSMESSRAGLPPPSSLGLPPPDVAFATMNAMNQSLPPPPPQRHGSDPSYYSWLESKTEEDRRRQEEEKTRQESLRLEQRKIEQSMLRDSLQAGVPPHLIPLIFAGISQGGVPQCVLDLTQQYMPQPSAGPRGPSTPLLNAAHPPPRRVPHVRQDSRSLPPNPYAAAPPPQPVPGPGVLLSQPLHPPGASPTTHSLSRPPVPSNSADPRPPGAARVPSGDAQAPPPSINLSNVQYAPGSSVPSAQHSSNRHDVPSRQSPPSLYFHHWIPPNQSHHPSAKSQQDPSATQPPRRSEYQSPPGPGRKRKSAGSHPPPPLPSSRPPETLSSSQSSRPESPHRQYSDMTTSSETGGPGPLDPDSTRSYSRDMPPTEDSRANRRRADTSTSESNLPFPRPSLHTRYDASMEPGPQDSDLDSSPGPSPTTRTHSTQSGLDASASTGPRARHR